ncbi:hypothetical protein [Methylocystis sp.]|uniref:hypothetical protein n=1 Tax=Methylocystis sp. TaxID=1911079 RepID=UPI003D0E273F
MTASTARALAMHIWASISTSMLKRQRQTLALLRIVEKFSAEGIAKAVRLLPSKE